MNVFKFYRGYRQLQYKRECLLYNDPPVSFFKRYYNCFVGELQTIKNFIKGKTYLGADLKWRTKKEHYKKYKFRL